MNITSTQLCSNSPLNCVSLVLQAQKFVSMRSDHTTPSAFVEANGSSPNGSPAKSFIQQRIERLYGPSALGIGFCAKRAQLERDSPSPKRSTSPPPLANEDFLEGKSPPGLPSVFKHLRPEFRHQLPVKPKRLLNGSRDSTSPLSNGSSSSSSHTSPKVRHIPIQLEEDIPDRTHSSTVEISVKPKCSPEKRVEVKLDLKNSLDLNRNVQQSNNESSSATSSERKDGHYFLKVSNRFSLN